MRNEPSQVINRAAAVGWDATDPLGSFRERFIVDNAGPIYMDGNSLGRLARPVAAAIAEGTEAWAARLVGGWKDWIDLPSVVGDRLGTAVGAAPGQVAVADSTTVNLYKLAAAALDAQPGRRVVVGDRHDFPTVRYVLQGLAARSGRELRLVNSDPVEGPDLDQLAMAVDEGCALLCLSHVNFRSAARLDLSEVTRVAHQRGAMVLWDLSHTAGALPVALDAWGADLAVGCTYKYLNAGPGAPAFLYVRREHQSRLRQPIWGWFGQRDQFAMSDGYEPQAGIGRFLSGTPPVLGLLAVDAAVGVVLEAGLDALWAKSEALTSVLVERVDTRLAPLEAALASPRDPARRGAHVSVSHPLARPLCDALIEAGMVVPDFRPPDVVRLGPAPLYRRMADVWDAVERMAEVLESGTLSARLARRPRVT